MIKHAAAMVEWKRFRPSKGTGGVAVYDYGSRNPRLLDRVANGGTLWLITSRRRGPGPRTYHMAYKLADCARIEPRESLFSGEYPYVVRAQARDRSRHFGYNEATDTLRRLEFSSGKPMSEVTNIGLRLLSIPELTPGDIALLERLEHRVVNGRAVFISYSHKDAALAASIELELGARDISTRRDVAILEPGQEWAAALQQEVLGCDCFLVLISAAAAAKPDWVKREVDWALSEYKVGGLVKAIMPILLPSGGWDAFPELHRFERWSYPPAEAKKEAFDRLAGGIVAARGRAH